MTPEQPTTDSASIEDRMAAVMSSTPEAAPEPEAPVSLETETEAPPSEAEEVETVEDDGYVEFTAEDGTAYRVPPALREAAEKGKGFTEKMQRLSQQQEQVDDRTYFVEAREKVMSEVMGDVAEFRSMQAEFGRWTAVQEEAFRGDNPMYLAQVQKKVGDLKDQLQAKYQHIQAKSAHIEKITADHSQKQWGMAVQGAAERIGKMSPQEDVAMMDTVKALGFSKKELEGRFADPRFLHAIYKAAKWDSLQSTKPASLNSVQKAPPVIRPGASKGPNAEVNQRFQERRAALRKSGSVDDAARLIQMMSK